MVAAGEPLVEIGDPEDLEIVVEMLSTEAVKVQPGMRAIIERWGGEQPLEGVVERVEPYGFTKISALGIEEQRVNVIVGFTGGGLERADLGHGFRVDVRVVVWEAEDVLTVPVTAVFRDGDGWAVFAVEDGNARLRSLTLGRRAGLRVAVTGGLDAGARVVLSPSERISALGAAPAVQRGLGEQVRAHRRGHEQEAGDQHLAQGGAVAGEPDARSQHQAADPERGGLRGAVQAGEEVGEAHQADGAYQREAADTQTAAMANSTSTETTNSIMVDTLLRPRSLDDVAAQQELRQRGRADETEQRDQQRRLVVQRATERDAVDQQQRDGVDVERVQGKDAVLDPGAAQQPPDDQHQRRAQHHLRDREG